MMLRFISDSQGKCAVSTRDWPPGWGKHHEALCAFNSITTRIVRDVRTESVELWQRKGDADQNRCLGAVPIEIDHRSLSIVLQAMFTSYERGFTDGQIALAAAVQAPISAALQGKK